MPTLICKQVTFYSQNDETSFFEWLKRIVAINEIEGVGNEIRLHIENASIDDESLRDLIAIFYRYGIELTQLSQFKNKDNEEWFYENKFSYVSNSFQS